MIVCTRGWNYDRLLLFLPIRLRMHRYRCFAQSLLPRVTRATLHGSYNVEMAKSGDVMVFVEASCYCILYPGAMMLPNNTIEQREQTRDGVQLWRLRTESGLEFAG